MKLPLAATLAAALLLSGCGSERTPLQSGGQNAVVGGSAGYQPYQTRDIALNCIKGRGISATPVGRDLILLSAPGARIVFEADRGVSSGMQVRGQVEGAEVIGGAVFYVGSADTAVTSGVEGCL
ncbi:MAG: hypothetical protein F2799_01845 [Actinobacteria bacterium]|nr:hypothetical protein [Actinomycetota bacterium]